MSVTKEVGYSYHTSDNAVRFGFSKTGCYSVSLTTDNQPPKAIAAFATKAKAFAYADTLPEQYGKWSIDRGDSNGL